MSTCGGKCTGCMDTAQLTFVLDESGLTMLANVNIMLGLSIGLSEVECHDRIGFACQPDHVRIMRGQILC